MPKREDFPVIFEKLKSILQSCDGQFTVKVDKPDNYYLDGLYSEKYKKEIFFGSVQIQKNYVSFYLMPVYMFPDLLDNIPDDLKKRMQGKSCFNFTSLDDDLINKIADLTNESLARVRQEKLL